MNRSALLVIDVQNGVIHGRHTCYDWQAIVGRIASLAERARKAGVPVVYVQEDDAGEEGSEPWQICAEVTPKPGETVVRKRTTDAFYATDLHDRLQAMGIDHLYVTGARTPYCVETVCRRATTLGYNVTLVGDAHTTIDTEVLPASTIIAHTNWILDGFDNLEHEVTVAMSEEISFA